MKGLGRTSWWNVGGGGSAEVVEGGRTVGISRQDLSLMGPEEFIA
jgi:hypothetical protein